MAKYSFGCEQRLKIHLKIAYMKAKMIKYIVSNWGKLQLKCPGCALVQKRDEWPNGSCVCGKARQISSISPYNWKTNERIVLYSAKAWVIMIGQNKSKGDQKDVHQTECQFVSRGTLLVTFSSTKIKSNL